MPTPSKTGAPLTKGKPNQCYNNARAECLKRPGSHYIVGWIHYTPKGKDQVHRIKHAWCEKGGVVYDSSPLNRVPMAEACSFVSYEPWAEYSVPPKPLDEKFPDGSTVVKVFPAAKSSVWFGSPDFKKVPKAAQKLQGSTMTIKIEAKSRLEAAKPKIPNFPTEFLKAMAQEATSFISSNLSGDEEREAFEAYSKGDQLEYGLNHDRFSRSVKSKYPQEFGGFTKLHLGDQIALVEPFFTKISY